MKVGSISLVVFEDISINGNEYVIKIYKWAKSEMRMAVCVAVQGSRGVKSILNGWSACSSSSMWMKIHLESETFLIITVSLLLWNLFRMGYVHIISIGFWKLKSFVVIVRFHFILLWNITSVLIIKAYFEMSRLGLYF